MILLDNKLKVTGVKIRPRNIFILDRQAQDSTLIALKISIILLILNFG